MIAVAPTNNSHSGFYTVILDHGRPDPFLFLSEDASENIVNVKGDTKLTPSSNAFVIQWGAKEQDWKVLFEYLQKQVDDKKVTLHDRFYVLSALYDGLTVKGKKQFGALIVEEFNSIAQRVSQNQALTRAQRSRIMKTHMLRASVINYDLTKL